MSVETPACRRLPACEARQHAQADHWGNLDKAQEAVFSSPPAAEDTVRACRTVHIQSDTTTVQGITCAHGQGHRWRAPPRAWCRSGATERPVPSATPHGMPRGTAEHTRTRQPVFTLFSGSVTPPAGPDSPSQRVRPVPGPPPAWAAAQPAAAHGSRIGWHVQEPPRDKTAACVVSGQSMPGMRPRHSAARRHRR